jgi:ComF family protein
MRWLSDFFSLFFPKICAACGNSLWKYEETICRSCEFHLPKTHFHLEEDNPVSRVFYGRVRIMSAAAWLSFNKGSKVQRLVHQLKYKGRKDIGILLGKMYGAELISSPFFQGIDLIIPVPLHKKKYMKRGYNQSEQFALGLSATMNIPVNRHLLLRIRQTESQTRKSRFKRYQNVKEIFEVTSPESWKNMHLLLVDDVVTTGATLEACITALHAIPGVRISIACIATARI